MDGRHTVRKKVLALCGGPFLSDPVDCFPVVPEGEDLVCQLARNVDREGFRKELQMPEGRNRLDSRDDRNAYASLAALVHETVVHIVVEEHLGYDVVGSGIDLLLEVVDVGLDVGSLEMLLGIASDSDSEEAFTAVPLFEVPDRPDQFVRMGEPSRSRCEPLFAGKAVAPQSEDIRDAHEFEILKLEFDLMGRGSAADDVRDDIDLQLGLYGTADCRFAYATPDKPSGEGPVFLLDIFDLVPVAGNVDVPGIELGERSYVVDELFFGNPCERGYDFQGSVGSVVLCQNIRLFECE